jgi:sulfide:quinone oxidoreductase
MAGKRILILGAGFGGLAAANLLRKNLHQDHKVIVIDKKKFFMMGFVKLWILDGSRKLEESQTSLDRLNAKGIEYLNDEIIKIDSVSKRVQTVDNGWIKYDYLIIALGAELAPEKISGFSGRGYNLYDAQQVPKLREHLLSLSTGKIAIAIADMPYKCPPAPYEAAMIISSLLSRCGIRSSFEIDLYTPTQIALPVAGPQISDNVVAIISQHGIHFHPLCKLKSVFDKQLEFENGAKVEYDVLIGIPPHQVPRVIKNSGLTEGGEWIAVDGKTMRTSFNDIFAVGDVIEIKVGAVAVPKAGIFAEEEAKVAARQIIDIISVKSNANAALFDGRGYCFMEVGDMQAGYLEADFYNSDGPSIKLEAPSKHNFDKKQDFERIRLMEWLLA